MDLTEIFGQVKSSQVKDLSIMDHCRIKAAVAMTWFNTYDSPTLLSSPGSYNNPPWKSYPTVA